MATMNEWVESSPERQKLFAEERLISLVAEEIYEAMEDGQGMSKTTLAKALGKSKAYVSQILSGSRNMTLRTLADIATSLGRVPEIHLRPQHAKSEWMPLEGASLVQLRPQARLRYECVNDGVSESADEAKAA